MRIQNSFTNPNHMSAKSVFSEMEFDLLSTPKGSQLQKILQSNNL